MKRPDAINPSIPAQGGETMDNFKITYKTETLYKTAKQSNEDLELQVQEREGRQIVTILAKKDLILSSFTHWEAFCPDKEDLLFFNGYQTWTDSKEVYPGETEHNVNRLPRFVIDSGAYDHYGDASFYEYDKNRIHGYDVMYCKGKCEKFVLNLLFREAYLLIEFDKKEKCLRLCYDYNNTPVSAGTQVTIAEFCVSDSVADGLRYFDSIFPRKQVRKLFGYTSWYHYYQGINEPILFRDLDALDERFDLFQIDDGYETHVGDWLQVDQEKFPHGLQPIVDAAHQKGLLAGIWLAPFVAEEKSDLFREKKDWFSRFADGTLVKCGSNWSGFYALDFMNPEVRDYIRACLQHYSNLGFDFFKLDFLYAVNLSVREGVSRSVVAERAYAFLRECLGDRLILGCGATLFNAVDKFDYMRVGPDISLKFDDKWYMHYFHRERISTKVTLQNTVYRSLFNDRLFGNDPDVFLLRDNDIALSPEQRHALLTLNALFGSVLMTSDTLSEYDEEKRRQLTEALDLFYNAEVTDYQRRKNGIEITFTKNKVPLTIKYDTERGVLS